MLLLYFYIFFSNLIIKIIIKIYISIVIYFSPSNLLKHNYQILNQFIIDNIKINIKQKYYTMIIQP
jgi:hypothetical protein